MADIQPGRYRHFKGNEYQVLGIARHSETLEEPLKKQNEKKTSENIWKIYLKVFTFASAFLKRKPT